MVWEGLDVSSSAANLVNVSRIAGLSAAITHTDTAVTTDENDTINLYFHMGDADSFPVPPSDYMMINPAPANANNHMTALWQVQGALGLGAAPTFVLAKSEDGLMMQVALKTGTSPVMPARVKIGSLPTTLIHPLYSSDTASISGGSFDPETTLSMTSINSVTYGYEAGVEEQVGGHPPPLINFGSTRFEIPSGGSANQHWGWGMANDEIDVSNKPIITHFIPHSPGEEVVIDGVTNGGLVVGLFSDMAGTAGARFWKISGNDALPVPTLLQGCVFDIADGPSQKLGADFGTFNQAKVDGVYMGILKAGAATSRFRMANCRALNTIVLVGGNVTQPCTFQTAVDALKASSVMSIGNQSGASGLQYSSRHALQIGDGTIRTYFKHDGSSWEFAPLTNLADKLLNHSVSVATLSLTLYGSSACTFNLDNVALGGPNDWVYTVHASHNAGATVTTVGHKVVGAEVTLQAAWAPTGAGVFDKCNEIIHNGANLSTGYIISNSRETNAFTITGATQTALQTAINLIPNTDFNGNTTALRVNYTETGTGTTNISLTGPAALDFDSNTTDLHYNSATVTSELTFTPGSGSDSPSTGFSGAASDVTIDNATAITLTAANLIDDTRYQIYNVTQSTELYNAIVSGGSGISINTTIGTGLAIVAGDVLRLRANYNVTTVFKNPIESTIAANVTSNVWLDTQTAWTEIESFALSSSGIDGVVFDDDTVNDTIDVLTNWSFSQFAVWWGLILTSELGIREWHNSITFVDNANARIDDVNLFLDNNLATTRWQTTTGRIYRADGARPVLVPPTSGGLDPQWLLPVLSISTGSVLTAGQQTELTKASEAQAVNTKVGTPAVDVSADIAAVKAETVLIVADTNELQSDDVPTLIAALPTAAEFVTEIETTAVLADGTLMMKGIAVAASGAGGGKASGAGTGVETFRNLADTADEMEVTVDADGNRTAVNIAP